METAMIYARVSTTAQGENYSLSTQLDMAKQHCERRSYRIHSEFTDMHSGTDSDRPGMNALLDAVAAQKPDAVVILDVDRLGRDTHVQLFLETELMASGARIEFVNGGTITADGDSDETMVDIKKLFAKQENRLRVERSRRGKRGRVEDGSPIPTAGKAPYGYDYVSAKKHEGKFVINEDEAKIVRQIYHWLVIELLSSYEIARRLHSMDIPTRGDTNTAVAKTAGHGEWSPTTIRRIIENSTYKGEWVWGKYRHIKRNGTRKQILQPESEWLKVAVPAIVSEDSWNAAQPRLSENKANATRNTKREYLLRGMIFCTCGRRWTGRFKTNVQRGYYRCPTTEAEGWRCNCDARFSYRVEELDSAIWQKVTEYLLQPETMIQEIRRQREANTVESLKRDRRLMAARKEVTNIEKKLAALLDSQLTGDYPKSVLESKRAELVERHKEFMDEVARLETERQAVDITPDIEGMLLALSRDMKDALPEMAFADKRRVLELLRTRIDVVDRDTVRLSGIITNGTVVDMRCSSPR